MWADPRRLADDGHVDMVDAAAALFDQRACMLRKARGGGAAPLRIAGREMVADIAFADRAEQGLGEGLADPLGVAMHGKAFVVRGPKVRRSGNEGVRTLRPGGS